MYQRVSLAQMSFTYSAVLWPWSGYLAIYLSVTKDAMAYTGEAKGHVLVTVSSPSVSRGKGHRGGGTEGRGTEGRGRTE